MSNVPSTTRAFLPITASVFLAMSGFGMMVPALPLRVAEVSAGAVAAGFLLSGFGAARLLVNLPAGIMSDRMGVQPTARTGLAILALGALLGGLPGGYALLFTALALQGVGSAIFATAAMSALAEIGGPQHRGAAMSAFQSAFLLAISGGPVVGGWLVDLFGSRAPFLLHAGIVAVTFFGVSLFPRTHAPMPARAGQPGAGRLLLRPLIAASCALGLAGFFARSAVGWALVPASAAHDFHLSPSQTGLLVGIGTLASLLLTPTIGRTIDRIGASKVLFASGIVTALSLAAFVAVPQTWMLWVTTAAVMIGTTGIMSAAGALVLAEAAGTGTGAALGLFRTAGDVGITLGPAGAPGLAAALGQAPVHGYSVVAASLGLATLVLLWALSRPRRAEAPAPAAE